MKTLSNQALIELGIEEKFRGKLWAYTPVMVKNYGWGLGIAVANEAGYSLVPAFFCNAERYEEMSKEAERLNSERGLSKEEEMKIVASSMGAGKVKKVCPDCGAAVTETGACSVPCGA